MPDRGDAFWQPVVSQLLLECIDQHRHTCGRLQNGQCLCQPQFAGTLGFAEGPFEQWQCLWTGAADLY